MFTAAIAAAAIVTIGAGLYTKRPEALRLSHRYAWGVLGATGVSVVAMQRALITRDFSLQYVAEHGSTRTPPLYNVATMWSALEGSILLWALVLAGYLTIVAVKFRRRAEDPLVGWAMLTMFVVVLFFAGLMLGPANPFHTVSPVPTEGPGPNPLLQNHWLVAFHPPMLYLGYVGFTVPFAFAIAALVTGRVGEGWLLETRRWTLFAWAFLTAGIVLGAWWSYDVLGWGGYWGWDPVENASFLPWLTGTAYLHSVMVQERRGMLRVWNLSLVCATFALTILGTFLTRSGVTLSVHAFSEGSIGPVLLGFFTAIVAVTVGLVYWRGDRLRAPGKVDSPLSREGAFFANNLLFSAFAFVVLLGTVFPLIVEAINDEQISVGAPYFERMTRPIGVVMLFLMAVAPVLPWRKTSGEVLSKRLEWPAWMGAGSLVLAVAVGARGLWPLLGFGLGGFAAGAALRQLVLATRRQGWRGLVGRANGGMIVHLGVILVAVAFTASQAYSHQAEYTMEPGDSVVLAGHDITFLGVEQVTLDNRIEDRAVVEVNGERLTPSVNRFLFSGMSIGTPATNTSLTEDVQVALLRLPDDATTAVLRVTIQPLVSWLWLGGAVIFVGSFLSAFPGRRRRPVDPVSAPVPEGAGRAGQADTAADAAEVSA
ncbi:MAG: heme lyase CcmF/NrfE family subunit [Acidimicrobiales bacterium]|nr:heme lyase CcmF/NrfE family subunit [Acidimicrobiales bacterium]